MAAEGAVSEEEEEVPIEYMVIEPIPYEPPHIYGVVGPLTPMQQAILDAANDDGRYADLRAFVILHHRKPAYFKERKMGEEEWDRLVNEAMEHLIPEEQILEQYGGGWYPPRNKVSVIEVYNYL